MKFTLSKQERLKSKKLIDKLYIEGKSVKNFPLRMIYLQIEHTSNFPVQMGVSVPKRNFKKAVDRNRIKRLLRESYRKQKSIIYNTLDKPYIFMISYLAKEACSYADIEQKTTTLLLKFTHKIKSDSNEK